MLRTENSAHQPTPGALFFFGISTTGDGFVENLPSKNGK